MMGGTDQKSSQPKPFSTPLQYFYLTVENKYRICTNRWISGLLKKEIGEKFQRSDNYFSTSLISQPVSQVANKKKRN